MKKITTLILLLIVIKAFSQEKGSLFLSVFPENAIIRLNDSLLKSQQTYTLDTGNYNVKMWLPTREYVERTINIKEAKTTRLHEVLSYSDDYKKYLRRKLLYKIDKVALRYIFPTAITYYIYKSITSYSSSLDEIDKEMKDDYEKAIQAKNNYENTDNQQLLFSYSTEYEFHKSKYNENLNKYNNNDKTNLIIISSSLVVANVALIYLSYKLKKPEYEEKILLSSITLNNYNNQVIPSVSLTYKFK